MCNPKKRLLKRPEAESRGDVPGYLMKIRDASALGGAAADGKHSVYSVPQQPKTQTDSRIRDTSGTKSSPATVRKIYKIAAAYTLVLPAIGANWIESAFALSIIVCLIPIITPFRYVA